MTKKENFATQLEAFVADLKNHISTPDEQWTVKGFIDDIVNGRGLFSQLGERWFDDYWMNYKKITIQDGKGETKKIAALKEFVAYRNGDVSLIVEKRNVIKS